MTEDFFDENSKKIMRTELNVPVVLYLCSEENQVSGKIYIMGAGWYGCAAVMTGGGFSFKDSCQNIAVEEIRDHFDEINDLDQTKPYESAAALLEDIFL